MCRILGVAPSGYYAWLLTPLSAHAHEDALLLRLIQASFTASHGASLVPAFVRSQCATARHEDHVNLPKRLIKWSPRHTAYVVGHEFTLLEPRSEVGQKRNVAMNV